MVSERVAQLVYLPADSVRLEAYQHLHGEKQLVIVPGAGHLFTVGN